MNVQHLEGVADAVATITGAPVNERLPEDVLLGADEIELVDMSPHALRQRMKHGNVYPPERTQVALEKFFTEANLTALRELALRLVAERVEGQLEDTTAGVQLPLVTDRVLVLVDGSPASIRAIRRAARLAVGTPRRPRRGRRRDAGERAPAVRPDARPPGGDRRRGRPRGGRRPGRGGRRRRAALEQVATVARRDAHRRCRTTS